MISKGCFIVHLFDLLTCRNRLSFSTQLLSSLFSLFSFLLCSSTLCLYIFCLCVPVSNIFPRIPNPKSKLLLFFCLDFPNSLPHLTLSDWRENPLGSRFYFSELPHITRERIKNANSFSCPHFKSGKKSRRPVGALAAVVCLPRLMGFDILVPRKIC